MNGPSLFSVISMSISASCLASCHTQLNSQVRPELQIMLERVSLEARALSPSEGLYFVQIPLEIKNDLETSLCAISHDGNEKGVLPPSIEFATKDSKIIVLDEEGFILPKAKSLFEIAPNRFIRKDINYLFAFKHYRPSDVKYYRSIFTTYDCHSKKGTTSTSEWKTVSLVVGQDF